MKELAVVEIHRICQSIMLLGSLVIHQKLRGATRSTTEHFSEYNDSSYHQGFTWDLTLMQASSLIVAMDRNYSYLVILPPQRNYYGSAGSPIEVELRWGKSRRGGKKKDKGIRRMRMRMRGRSHCYCVAHFIFIDVMNVWWLGRIACLCRRV
ncbi:hypothetical protein GQ457_11G013990 [Hibiscus cannabinus]